MIICKIGLGGADVWAMRFALALNRYLYFYPSACTRI